MKHFSVCYGLFAIILWFLSFASLAKSELIWQQPVSALKDNNCAFLSSAKCLTRVSHFPAANRASSVELSSQGGDGNPCPCTSSALRCHQIRGFPFCLTPAFALPLAPQSQRGFCPWDTERWAGPMGFCDTPQVQGEQRMLRVRQSSQAFLGRFGPCLAAASCSQCHLRCPQALSPALSPGWLCSLWPHSPVHP